MGKFRPQLQQEGIGLDNREHDHQDGHLLQGVFKADFGIFFLGIFKSIKCNSLLFTLLLCQSFLP